MKTPLTTTQLERLRRVAKKLAREKSVRLCEAQDELASQRGYPNWSQLVKASKASTAISQLSEKQRRRAFATLYLRRQADDILFAALHAQLRHVSRRATEIYGHGDAKKATQNGRFDQRRAQTGTLAKAGQARSTTVEHSTAGIGSAPPQASAVDEVAQMLGHVPSDVTRSYLRRPRTKGGTP